MTRRLPALAPLVLEVRIRAVERRIEVLEAAVMVDRVIAEAFHAVDEKER